MTYQDFVGKMDINTLLMCPVYANTTFMPTGTDYFLTVKCNGPDNSSRRYTFEAVVMSGDSDAVYRARYSSPAATKWTGWKRVEMASI